LDERPSKSGYIVSGAMHAALLGAIIVGFSQAPKFDDAAESFPVETITQSQFNEIMKGEHNGKPVKTPVEKPAPKPVEATAPTPPDAEIDRPIPRLDSKASPTPEPPTRPKIVDKPKDPTPDKPKLDSVAKFLEKAKAEDEQKTPTKPKSADAPVDPPRQPYDPNAIAKLIGQAKPAPNRQVASLTPLGSQTQNAPRMSPSLSASLDGWLQEAYLNCWTQPPTMPQGEKYVALVHVSFNPDGSLAAQPQLVNPPSDPAWRAYSESAMRAVLKCNPLHVPPQYVPYFEQWKAKTVHFDPQDAQG
jgi:colicin import membrane protein